MQLKTFEDSYHEFFNITCRIGAQWTCLKDNLLTESERTTYMDSIFHGIQELEGIMQKLLGEMHNDPNIIASKRKEPDYTQSGWINPNGIFYPCNLSEHLKLADALLLLYYKDVGNVCNPDDYLLKHGWVKLQYNTQRSIVEFYHYLCFADLYNTPLERCIRHFCERFPPAQIKVNDKVYSDLDAYFGELY